MDNIIKMSPNALHEVAGRCREDSKSLQRTRESIISTTEYLRNTWDGASISSDLNILLSEVRHLDTMVQILDALSNDITEVMKAYDQVEAQYSGKIIN